MLSSGFIGGVNSFVRSASECYPLVLVASWSRSDAISGKLGFYLGKEAVPRHRLQALLSRGEFDRALDLARAHSMDETDVHAARLLALLREGAEAATTGEVIWHK